MNFELDNMTIFHGIFEIKTLNIRDGFSFFFLTHIIFTYFISFSALRDIFDDIEYCTVPLLLDLPVSLILAPYMLLNTLYAFCSVHLFPYVYFFTNPIFS